MAFPRSFLRHTLLWNLPGGEKAACSVHWDNNGGGIIGAISPAIQAMFVAKQNDLWAGIGGFYSDQTFFTGGRLAVVGVNGLTSETVELGQTPSSGSVSQPPLPQEVAMVASLRTANGTRRGKGRIYLPGCHVGYVSNAGRIVPNLTAALASQVAVYLEDETVSPDNFFSVVASKVGGLLTPITQVRVGDVFDSQRRRRDSLVEVYNTVNV